MRRSSHAALAAASLGLVLAAAPGAASAGGVVRPYGYAFDQVWSATVRLLRVDRGFKILEKDPETGYILFEFKESAKDERSWRAGVELLRDKDESGRTVIKVKIEIQDKPELPDAVLHDRLREKLRAEYGPPFSAPTDAPPPKDKPKDPPKDAPKDEPAE